MEKLIEILEDLNPEVDYNRWTLLGFTCNFITSR